MTYIYFFKHAHPYCVSLLFCGCQFSNFTRYFLIICHNLSHVSTCHAIYLFRTLVLSLCPKSLFCGLNMDLMFFFYIMCNLISLYLSWKLIKSLSLSSCGCLYWMHPSLVRASNIYLLTGISRSNNPTKTKYIDAAI